MKKVIFLVVLCVLISGIMTADSFAEYSREEIRLLASAVESEASGESYTVMLAVASVLVNRMNDSDYPDTLGAVIFDSGIVPGSDCLSNRALKAAEDALLGFDPTSGALRYGRGEVIPNNLSQLIRLRSFGWYFY